MLPVHHPFLLVTELWLHCVVVWLLCAQPVVENADLTAESQKEEETLDEGIMEDVADEAGVDTASAEEEDEEEEDDDDDGWITPSNLAAAKKAMTAGDVEEVSSDLPVACMTTDYAMQVCTM